jgi:hypothetical protein
MNVSLGVGEWMIENDLPRVLRCVHSTRRKIVGPDVIVDDLRVQIAYLIGAIEAFLVRASMCALTPPA